MAKKNTFVINGKTYTAHAFDFNTVCDLEDRGISIMDMQKKPISTARAYFAICYDGEPEAAGKEIEKHLVNGGDLTGLMDAMSAEMEASDFFQALSKNAEKENQSGAAEKEKTEE